MRASVLVINPWITDFKLYDEWMHPLGLYLLISHLMACGADASYFDCIARSESSKSRRNGTGDFEAVEIAKPGIYENVKRRYKRYGCSEQRFRDFLADAGKPDVICIGSMMTYWAEGLVQTVAVIREVFPTTPIVVGGIAARLMPRYVEARLGGGCTVAGPLFASDHITGFPGALPSPFPLRGADPEALSLLGGLELAKPKFHGPVISAYGCPMRCSYCASHALSPSYVPRSPDMVSNEIRFLAEKMGVREFAFYDDALLYGSETHLVPILKSLRRCGSDLHFHTPNGLHARYAEREKLDIMKEAGFVTLRFGYESGAQEYRLDTSSKAQWSDLKRAVENAIMAGFAATDIGVYVMAGLHGQKPSDMLTELNLVSSLGVLVKPVFLSPVPGTRLFETYAREFPQLHVDPLWHNDTFFITRLAHWDQDAVEEIRLCSRRLNSTIRGQ